MMRYFVPDLRVPELGKPQAEALDKLGGIPWGISRDDWQKCSSCGTSLSLLAQFKHHESRLDLGRDGRVLFVFHCNNDPGICETWEGGSGANACFVLEPEAMLGRFSELPEDNPVVELEAVVTSWLERDDGVTEQDYRNFFCESDYLDIFDTIGERVSSGTKLGGVPNWIQNPDEAPKGGWEFVGQLDSTYSFYSPPETLVPEIIVDEECWENRTHYAIGPNLGDGGIGYIFLRKTAGVPEGWFFGSADRKDGSLTVQSSRRRNRLFAQTGQYCWRGLMRREAL